jgi:ATP-binding cassette, subfamily B, bacterial
MAVSMRVALRRRTAGTRRRMAGIGAAARLLRTAAPAQAGGAVLVAVLEGVAPTTAAVATKVLIDGLIARDAASVVWGTALVIGALLVIAFLTPVSAYLQTEITRRVELKVSDQLFAAVNAVPRLDQFEHPAFHDRVRLAQQAGLQAPQQVTTGMITIFQAGIGFAGFTIALFAVSPPATFLAVAAVVPSAIVGVRLSAGRAKVEMALSPGRRRTLFYAMMQTDPRAAKEIRLFGLGDFLRGRMLSVLTEVTTTERARDRSILWWQLALQVVSGALFAGAIAVVARGVWTGGDSVGDVALTLAALAGVQAGVTTINSSLGQLTNSLALFDNYRDIIDESVELRSTSSRRATTSPAHLRSGLTMRDVWFRYDEGRPWTIQGVDLHLPAGTSTALVGVNGAGKSTIVKLLCGLYAPTRGEILWDGVPVTELDVAGYRRRFSAVFQDFMTYDLSARENIGLGDLARAAETDAIEDAARAASIHDALAALPAGYATFLSRMFFDETTGERGAQLSGGQWQRLAIARAMMRTDSDVFILDEPSSGLDPDAEYRLTRTLFEMRRDKTSLLISHRLSAVTDADNIVVLHDGRITEQGTHRELVRRGGRYAEMFDKQASGYQDAQVRPS